LELARDLFVFGCWTGISFIGIKKLTTDNITWLRVELAKDLQFNR
jgi:hypothetical protein